MDDINAIEFKNINKFYIAANKEKSLALQDFNLCIPKGEFFGLLGHNGAGKTTAIQILSGICKPSSGEVLIHGESVLSNPSFTKRVIGVVQQELLIDSFFKLPDMLAIQSKLYGAIPDKAWIEFLLEQLQLQEHIKKTTRELSGGMKRRMMIARALVHKPSVLVLDEPTAGVDVQLRLSMWEFISELHKQGMSIILTTHYLEEAENFCSRIGILKKGKLVVLKRNAELLACGAQPKFSFNIKISGVNSIEKTLICNEIKAILSPIEVKVEFISIEKNIAKINISLAIIYQNLSILIEYLQKIKTLVEQKNWQIESFYTEQPSLEEVFIKLLK